MARKVEALDMRAEPAPRRHVEDAERDRQALAAVDHAQEVGVLQIVIGRPVARIAERAAERGGQPVRAARRLGELVEMAAVAVERHARPVERAEQQGRLADVERLLSPRADLAQPGFRRAHATRLPPPSSSLHASAITMGSRPGTTATTSKRTAWSR